MREELIGHLLLEGLDDWVHMGQVVSEVVRAGVGEEALLGEALLLIGDLLRDGWMEAGSTAQGGFAAWPTTPEESVARIEAEWRALGRLPTIGDICWLSNTPKGDARARQRSS